MTTHRDREVVTTVLVGYARVSTLEQDLALQEAALKKAGCIRVFTDIASGKRGERPGLADVMKFLREGDTLVVWKLDRLGRSVQHLIEILNGLEKSGVKIRSLTEHLNTESAAGKMFFQMVAIFAEFERELIRERTRAGLQIARARGRLGGRKPILNDKDIQKATALLNAKPPIAFIDVCATIGCSERTLRRRMAELAQ